jgi:hypothetical protein
MPLTIRSLALAAALAAAPGALRAQSLAASLPWPAPEPDIAHMTAYAIAPTVRLVGTRTRPARAAAPATAGPIADAPLVDGWAPLTWPAPPTPREGALLPSTRIIAAYGHPASTRMGILGSVPTGRLEDSLAALVSRWQRADSSRATVGALHLIATVAQGQPGADGHYRLRHPAAVIDRIVARARARGFITFVDVQPGLAPLGAEVDRLMPWLAEPDVHLAIDPEFAMPAGQKPGGRIGTLDAATINPVLERVARLVDSLGLPPKVVVIHRFTGPMLTNAEELLRDPAVQIVIEMDGWGAPALKRATYRDVITRRPVQYTGFKLFTTARHDGTPMAPDAVLRLRPVPLYIQYQ